MVRRVIEEVEGAEVEEEERVLRVLKVVLSVVPSVEIVSAGPEIMPTGRRERPRITAGEKEPVIEVSVTRGE